MPVRHSSQWWWGALGAALLGVHLSATSPALGETAWTLLVVGACAGVLVGTRRNRPSASRPWHVIAGGLGLLAAGNVATHPLTPEQPWASMFGQLAELVAFPMFAGAALAMVRRQAPHGDREGALDAAIVMVALFTALAGTVFTADAMQVTTRLGHLVLVLGPLLLAAVAASAARLVFAGTRVPSTYLLAAVSLSALIGHVLRTLAQSSGTYQRGGWDDLLIGLAYVGVGLAGLHPSMARLTEARPPDERRLTRSRLGVLGMSLLTPPVTLLLSGEAGAVGLVGSVLVSVLVLSRLWRLVMDREAVRDEMRHRSIHDALTGLPNRVHLLERLGTALRAGGVGKTAVLFIDLDGFKQVNDDFGHRVGDAILLAVVARLRGVVRDQDLLGRLAGDEFVVVCEDVDEEDVAAVAARLLGAFAQPFALPPADVALGASIGVALGHAGRCPEQLLHEADAAMYDGKQRGGGTIEFFGEELGSRLQRRRRLEADLPVALQQGTLRLVYQPIVALAEHPRRVVGVEALLRWDHPTLGAVEPAELVPLADASGRIADLGAWVIRQACQQLAAWRRERELGPGFRVFVNLSTRQLLHPDLAAQVQDILAATAVAPTDLVLEVTETAVLEDDGLPVRVCRSLRELGVAIALDDFGTGYSSLTHLKRLPIDLIKIDASFVQDLWRSRDDQAIVRAVLSIARQLGAEVVGEGVESLAQQAVLRRLGCDYGQGHRLGRPCPPEALELAADPLAAPPVVSRGPTAW